MSQFFFATAAKSAVGIVRAGNEDSALTSKNLVAVADGMGGHAGGEVASKIAITTLAKNISHFVNPDDIHQLFESIVQSIEKEIHWAGMEEPDLAGLGTTLSALFLHQSSATMIHVGDSRIYRLRGNSLEQMTNDHTVIQQLLDSGTLSPEEIANHPQRSVLTHVLMGEGENGVVLNTVDARADDRFILCSDGLTNVLSDKEIKTLVKDKPRGAAVDALIEATYAAGAPDNVTVIVADLLGNDIQEPITMLGAAQ